MKVLSVMGGKGGIGKSTTSINIAAAATINNGLKVLFCDLDPTGVIYSRFKKKDNNYPFTVCSGFPKEKPVGYDLIIFDYPAGYNKPPSKNTNAVIEVMVPTRIVTETLAGYKHLIDGYKSIKVLNSVEIKNEWHQAPIKAIEEEGGYIFPYYKSLPYVDNLATHVFDKNCTKFTKIAQARRDYRLLTNMVLKLAGEWANEQ